MRFLPLSLIVVLGCRSTNKLPGDGLLEDTAGLAVDADGDGYDSSEDCDDNNSIVHPSASELCDGADNNCDGQIDEGVTSTFYADTDADGFGDPDAPAEACEAPSGTVPNGNDCDDTSAASHPGAEEVCDGLDNDCDGQIDDGLGGTFYPDADGDGHGDASAQKVTCIETDGYVEDASDCDDADAAINPDAAEVCDEADNDCDGQIDEGTTTTFYADVDTDGYGDADAPTEACSLPPGHTSDTSDCDDSDGAINPAAVEICNETDDNCDGQIDEDAADASTFYADADADGYGDAADSTDACAAPSGTTVDTSDCDDSDGAVNPGASEVCNEVDDDCDGQIDEDAADAATFYADDDSDGYGDVDDSTEACSAPSGYTGDDTDCDDTDAAISPGASEVCNEVDDDCDGLVDDDDDSLDASTGGEFYGDADLDGYGDVDDLVEGCVAPSGYVSDDTDCDDGDADINPAASEECDGVDNDCTGDADDGGLCPCDVEYYDDHPYMFCDVSYTWSAAESYCDGYDYHLVTIDDADEDSWVDATADSASSSDKWWMGYNDVSSEGSWVWSDGSSSTYTNWHSGEPNNSSNEDCGQLNRYTDGSWNDEPCSYALYFVCEAG